LLAFYYAVAVIGQVTQASFMKLNNKTPEGDVVRFSFFKAFFAFLLFFLLFFVTRDTFHLPTMLYGILFGVCIACSSFFGYRALGIGPLSLTYMLFNFCIVISCLYGVILQHNTVTLSWYLGFALMFASMALLNFKFGKKKDVQGEQKGALSLKWAILVAITILGDGFCQISQTAHQSAYPELHQVGFMMWAMLTWSVIFLAIALFTGKLRMSRRYLRSDLYAAGSGLSNSLANFFILKLAAMSAATLLFPTLSVVTMLAALLAGIIFFREKLSLTQIAGFLLGAGSIFLMKVQF